MSDPFKDFLDDFAQELEKCELTLEQQGEVATEGAEYLSEKVKSEINFSGRYSKGFLKKAGIAAETFEDGTSGVGWTGDGWYGRIVESGSIHQAAQPHVRPVFEKEKNNIADKMAKKIEEIIK